MKTSSQVAWLATTALLLITSNASTLTPPVLPLIVRNPYLSTWLANARDVPWSKWPQFYTGQEIGFSVLASIPETSTVYPLLGRPHDSLTDHGNGYNISYATYLGAQYDASVTNLTYRIPAPDQKSSPAELILSFLSPITPTSTLRQSIPAAYLTIQVTASFDVDVYVDVNGQWVSGNRASEIEWQLDETDHKDAKQLKTWSIKRRVEQLFTEWNDRAEWGTLAFTGPSDVRHECGTSALLRNRFSKTGKLQNAVDSEYRSIMDEEPVFAFSKSFKLGSNKTSTVSSSSSSDSVLFTIAHIQDPVVQFASARGLTYMRPLWKSWFPTNEAVTSFHYHDFHNATKLAQNYSSQLAVDAYASGSDSYVDIVALSARQTMGATSFSGTADDPILFLKEISSNGNSQTVDVIFPAFPFFLYTNPRWLAYMLEPLLEHMLSGQYPNKYTMHDLGTHFPNLTGHADGRDEYMPVEECGDMLIMGLALVNSLIYTNDTKAQSIWSVEGSSPDLSALALDTTPFALPALETRTNISYLDDRWGGSTQGSAQARHWLRKSYSLWKQWTGYLVEYTLEPHNQLSTDDFAGWLALQTNLALKGIVGIKAMSELAVLMGEHDDAKHYRNISDVYIARWQELGMSRDGTHAKLAYNWYGSWTTLYSLYADALLCFHPDGGIDNTSSTALAAANSGRDQTPLSPVPNSRDQTSSHKGKNFIPSSIYAKQSVWYSSVMQRYGLPLDSRHLYAKSDWEFEAAAVSSRATRTQILDAVAKWLNETETDRPFTDLYKTEEKGGFPGPNFFARPVVGAHFAFLTLERACEGNAVQGLKFLDEGA